MSKNWLLTILLFYNHRLMIIEANSYWKLLKGEGSNTLMFDLGYFLLSWHIWNKCSPSIFAKHAICYLQNKQNLGTVWKSCCCHIWKCSVWSKLKLQIFRKASFPIYLLMYIELMWAAEYIHTYYCSGLSHSHSDV